MEIDGWSIDTFGALRDVEHRGLGKGLTVIYGPNEAGKSTLRHFVLGALFGYTSGSGKDPLYEPSSGGMRAGRLFLRSNDEELVLSRVEQRNARAGVVTLYGPGGVPRPDAEVNVLLGGLTRSVYNRVFALGLDELNDLAALTEGDLQDHLLSAGVTGAGRVATQARNTLRARADEIHKARASTTRVAALRDQLRRVEAELKDAQRAATQLGERRELLEQRRKEVAQLAEREREATVRAARAQRLVQLWPSFVEASSAESALAELGPEPPAVADGLLDAVADRQSALNASAAEVETRRAELDQATQALSLRQTRHRPGLAALAPQAAAINNRLGAWAQQEEELSVRREELADLNRRLTTELEFLGVADAADLARVGAAVAARDALRAARTAFDEKATTRLRAAEAVDHHQSELAMAEAAVSAWGDSFGRPANELTSAEIRTEVLQASQEVLLLGELATELNEFDRRKRDAVEAPRAAAEAEPRTNVRTLLMIGAGVLLVGAIIAMAFAGPVAAGMVGFAALVLGGASQLVPKPNTQEVSTDRGAGREAVLAEVERRVSERASALGFDGIPTIEEVTGRQVTREQERIALADLVGDLQRVEQVRSSDRAARRRYSELSKQYDAALGQWSAWLESHALPSVLRPEGVDEWLAHLDQARALHGQIEQATVREHELAAALAEAPVAVADLVAEIHRTADEVGEIPKLAAPAAGASLAEVRESLAALESLVAEAVAADQELAREHDELAILEREVDRANEAHRQIQATLDELLASAGVTDLAALRARVEDLTRRAALGTAIAEFDRQLVLAAGRDADADRAILAERTPDAWQADAGAAANEASEATAARDAALLELGVLEREVADIEGSGDLASLALRREELVEELRRLMREWTVAHVAAGLIDHTLERYLEERQPAVIQLAEQHLLTITDGRYRALRLDPEATGRMPRLTVVDQSGSAHSPMELSRGTVEQVYLCLRLALAEQHRTPLPLLLDDILVNFDPMRAIATTKVLAEVAVTRQVLVYTCHPWVVEVVREVDAQVPVVELERTRI